MNNNFPRKYKGSYIRKASPNPYGFKSVSEVGWKVLQADTLAGIKKLITESKTI